MVIFVASIWGKANDFCIRSNRLTDFLPQEESEAGSDITIGTSA